MITKRKPLTLNRLRDKARRYNYIIGIDPGVNTGLATWWPKGNKFFELCAIPIHEAMAIVKQYNVEYEGVFVRIEDARKRKWFGTSGREQLQGAGSIKRDCKIWEDFLSDLRIDFEMVAPKNNRTKLDAKKFKLITKWEGITNEHSRDAAMLCFGY